MSQDESCLDTSTVPTYEEFTAQTSDANYLRKMQRYLNSTEASCLLTDDEDEDSFDKENTLKVVEKIAEDASIIEITNSVDSVHLDKGNKPKSALTFNSILKTPCKEFKASLTPGKQETARTPLHQQQQQQDSPFMLRRLQLEASNSNKKPTVTPRKKLNDISRTKTPLKTAVKPLEEAVEYVLINNVCTQTSFSLEKEDHKEEIKRRSPSIIVLDEIMGPERIDKNTSPYQSQNEPLSQNIELIPSFSSCLSPARQTPNNSLNKFKNLDTVNVTLRKSLKKVSRPDLSLSKDLTQNWNKPKRVSICGDGMSKTQLRVDDTILDESENESDLKSGKIYSLYETQIQKSLQDSVDEEEKIIEDKQKTLSSTSEDTSDDKFENFLKSLKQPEMAKDSPNTVKSKALRLKDFLVDDSSSESEPEDSRFKPQTKTAKKIFLNNSTSSSDSDEQLFYIKTTNKLVQEKKKKISFKETRRSSSDESIDSIESRSSSSDSDDEVSSRFREINSKFKNVSQASNVFKTPTTSRSYKKELRLIQTQQIVRRKESSKLSFVESLSTTIEDENLRDSAAANFIKKFKNKNSKNELLRKCFDELNEVAFENKLPKDMVLAWSSRLTSTGGFCKNFNANTEPRSEIQISTKVCDTPERMRDVLAHEMCHAASFLLSGVLDGHGSIWKGWATRVNFAFKLIPKITVFHSYEVKKKFIFKCTKCFNEIHRFSKSIDITKQGCGLCFGRFEIIQNKPGTQQKLNDKNKKIQDTMFDTLVSKEVNVEIETSVPVTPRPLNAFSKFVKEKYHEVKRDKGLSSNQDVMKELGALFKQMSTN